MKSKSGKPKRVTHGIIGVIKKLKIKRSLSKRARDIFERSLRLQKNRVIDEDTWSMQFKI